MDPRHLRRPEAGAAELAAVAAAAAAGMAMLRSFAALSEYALYGGLRWPAALVALLAGVVLASGALAPAAVRRFGMRRALGGCALALGACRALPALLPGLGAPARAGLSAAGAAAFLLLLPLWVAAMRRPGVDAGRAFATALLAGVGLDAALLAASGTYDPVWQATPAAVAATLAVAAALVAATAAALPRVRPTRRTPPAGFAWAAVGALLFVELGRLGNAARLDVASGLGPAACAGAVVVGASAAVAVLAAGRPPDRRSDAAAAAALLLGALPLEGLWACAAVVAAHAGLGVLLARAAGGRRASVPRTPLPLAAPGLVLGGLVGLHYAPQGLAVPFGPGAVFAVAVATIALAALRAPARPRRRLDVSALAAAAAVALAGAPAAFPVRAPRGREAAPAGRLKVVSYNIHKGFAAEGALDLEAIAREIEREGADVVALQEVTRGQFTEANVDSLAWLSRRLDMPFLYEPTSAGLWGQAVLTRLPVLAARRIELPPRDLPTARSATLVTLDVGGTPVRLLNTHYTANFGHAARLAHSREIAALLAASGPERTIVVGDLNARPAEPPVAELLGAGLRDAGAEAGMGDVFTAPSPRPSVRIDYVLYTPDLALDAYRVGSSLASDHFPVIAEFSVR